jgi:microcystin-dependent protein
VATALTGSLALDGQSAMTGQFKAADGSAAAPGVTYGSDLDSGFYRKGSNNIGAAAGGALIWEWNASGITLATGKTLSLPVAGVGFSPVGTIDMFAGPIASVPSGWLICDGSAISRTTYAGLFAIVGTIYGAGDGSTTFNLPDLRDKFIVGARQDDSGVPKTNITGSLTASGGSKDAVNVSHTHTATVTDSGHTHTTAINYTTVGGGGSSRQWYGRTGTLDVSGSTDSKDSSSATTGVTVSNSTEGASGTNANLPPYVVLAYKIKH